MKNHIYKSAVVLLSAGMMFASCSDFLEAENKTAGGQLADDIFSKDASTLLVNAYESLKTITTQVGIFDQGTDLFFNTRGHAGGNFNEYTLTSENEDVTDFYSDTYNTINYANGVIYYAGEDSELGAEARFIRNYGYYLLSQQFGGVPYITEYINSAKQDYPRTELSELYTNVIADLTDLYNNSSLDAQNHEGRASKQAVAALLAKLYLAAGWDLDTSLGDALQGTYTVNSTDNFTQAASWAEKAINGVSLTMSFADKWAPTNEGNAEEIWSVQYDRASYPGEVTTGGHSLQNNYGGYFGNVTDYGQKYTSSDNQPTAKAIALYEPGDLRYEATFMTTYYNSTKNGGVAEWGEDGYFAYYNKSASALASQHIGWRFYPYYMTQAEVEADLAAHQSQYASYENMAKAEPKAVRLDDGNNVLIYSFNADGSIKSHSTKTYTDYMEDVEAFGSVKKFDDPESAQLTGSNDYRDIVIFHVSDMYLVAAEAYYMAGQTTQALQKINDVRTRAGLGSLTSFSDYTPQYTTSSTFTLKAIDLILDERARELYAERQRWMDLRRTKQLIRYNVEFNPYITDASAMQNVAGEYKWLRPIPSTEISSNTGIGTENQNPGY